VDRPDLQRLLDDLRRGLADIIVVYKIDLLSRSLADFAKLVELFDQHAAPLCRSPSITSAAFQGAKWTGGPNFLKAFFGTMEVLA